MQILRFWADALSCPNYILLGALLRIALPTATPALPRHSAGVGVVPKNPYLYFLCARPASLPVDFSCGSEPS